jgi:hypothetical protein|tara:strand:+ start:288 stop:572 length:285 start_codon:yes stop_codon:yes gene_type:complete
MYNLSFPDATPTLPMSRQGLGSGHEIFASLLLITSALPVLVEEAKRGRPTGRNLDLKYNFQEAGREMSCSLYYPQGIHDQKEVAAGGGFAWTLQ